MSHTDRVVVLVDMDCFYCQVEERLDPNLKGKPIAVVQYNAWRGGGIIAVNYPARDRGVTRHMRGDEARKKCPEIILPSVPEVRGKADLTKYRDAGKEVAEVLKTFTPLLERASVDEAYLDITDAVNKRMTTDFEQLTNTNMKNSYVVGWNIEDFLDNIHQNKEFSENHCKLAMGGLITEEIRAEVLKKTGYKCSAGVAHNKILAKLVCGLHKPNKQTILPHESVPELYRNLPISKVNSLGGKFGNILSEKLNITKMGELIQFNEKQLSDTFDGKTANWLYNIARGIDLEPVTVRLISKSIGCSKGFPGRSALISPESVTHWVRELSSEITERLQRDLEENNRKAKQIVISFAQEIISKDVSSTRTIPLPAYDQIKIAQSCLDAIKKNCLRSDGTYRIKFLGISIGNFEDIKNNVNITTFFKTMRKSKILETTLGQTCNKSIDSQCMSSTCTTNACNPKPSSLKENESSRDNMIDADNNFDDDNASIYSASTEELNEDEQSLILFEDVYPELVASQPILEEKHFINSSHVENYDGQNDKMTTSIEDSVTNKSSKNSFFTKFFEGSALTRKELSSVSRNFDTSKILEERESGRLDENISWDESLITQSIADKSDNLNSEADGISGSVSVSSLKDTCPECNKKISSWELQAHMDYHYALKIVKTEAHLYTAKQDRPKVDKNTENQGMKRKLTKDTKPLLAFLKREELTDENSTVCSECNKPIKLNEIESHTDYHLAKKLHLEINSCKSTTPNAKMENKSNIKSKNQKRDTKTKNLDYFFKIS